MKYEDRKDFGIICKVILCEKVAQVSRAIGLLGKKTPLYDRGQSYA